MAGKITFSMVKPGAVKENNTGEILASIEKAGFVIKALKKTRLSLEQAQKFYGVHKERPFFNELIDYMVSGPIYAFVVEKDNAVEEYRKLIGATNPAEAEDGTIRKRFAKSIQDNAVHGSDSDENAKIEASFFFAETEIF